MAKSNLGRVAMHPAGVWNAFTQYKRLDVVEDNEGSYMAILDNVNTSTTNTSVWQKVAGRGPAGIGNVTALSEENLVSGEKYVFRPTKDGAAMGEFVPFTTASQIQSDWNQNDTSHVDYIKNKPIIPDEPMQSDWNQENDTLKDFIKNKPEYKTVFSQVITGIGDITPKVIKDINYNPETGDWTFTFADNTPNKVINVPVDNFLNEADYNGTTHILTMYMSDGSIIEVNLEDLIQEYKAAENGGLEVVNGNEFKIKDQVFAKITQQPISGNATVSVSSWTQIGDYWHATIHDANVVDGCIIDLGSDIATYPIFKKAAFLPVTDSNTAGEFTIMAEKLPTGNINLLYSIII